MKIDFTCPNCQRKLRVASEHIGKKAKCPSCSTVSVIKDTPAQEAVAPIILTPSQSKPPSLFDSDDDLFSGVSQAPVRDNSNPFAPLSKKPAQGKTTMRQSEDQTDLPGLLSVIFGGLCFLSLLLCLCFSPLGLISLIGSIAGLVLSFYAKPPLKMIGMIVNGIVLVICIIGILLAIVVLFLGATGTFDPPRPRARQFGGRQQNSSVQAHVMRLQNRELF